MADISWTEKTWNPVTGCTPVSEGCDHCYAKRLSKRFGGDFSQVTCHPDRLDIPLRRQKPTTYFVPSMGDLFHEDVPYGFIRHVFMNMALAERHTFQVLTKRPAAARLFFASTKMLKLVDTLGAIWEESGKLFRWPLPNVWVGVTAENQARADERIPILLDTPAARRFVSLEPLLGPIDLEWHIRLCRLCYARIEQHVAGRPHGDHEAQRLDWVIVGGESGGPPERALVDWRHGRDEERMTVDSDGKAWCRWDWKEWWPKREALEWVRSIRDQCEAAGVPFHFKGWGGRYPNSGGHLLDGREWRDQPA